MFNILATDSDIKPQPGIGLERSWVVEGKSSPRIRSDQDATARGARDDVSSCKVYSATPAPVFPPSGKVSVNIDI